MNRLGTLVFVATVSLPIFAATRTIVPVYGQDIRGWSGIYSSTIVLTNLGQGRATVRVVDVLPIWDEPCNGTCRDSEWELQPALTPGAVRVVSDQGGAVLFHGRRLRLGAVVLETEDPVLVESEVFSGTWGELTHRWQHVDVTAAWIEGGATAVIPRGLSVDSSARFSLYLVNPNDTPIQVRYWSNYREGISLEVPARASRVVSLDARPLFPDGGAEQPTGFALSLFVSSDRPFLAASTANSAFGAPPDVHVARQLTK